MTIKIVSPEEAERADRSVCMRLADMPVGFFADDVIGACAECGAAIRHRPHLPKRPPKVCLQCAFPEGLGSIR